MGSPPDADDDLRLLAAELLLETSEAVSECPLVCPEYKGVLDEAKRQLEYYLRDHREPPALELQLACTKADAALRVWRSIPRATSVAIERDG